MIFNVEAAIVVFTFNNNNLELIWVEPTTTKYPKRNQLNVNVHRVAR